jgi:hypothetical protein
LIAPEVSEGTIRQASEITNRASEPNMNGPSAISSTPEAAARVRASNPSSTANQRPSTTHQRRPRNR